MFTIDYALHVPIPALPAALAAVALQVPEYYEGKKIVTERFIKTAKKQNIEVHAWTINEVDDMKRMISMGVEGIVTDYPDRLLRVLERL